MDPKIRKKDTLGGCLTAWEGYLTIPYISVWKEKLSKLTLPKGTKLSIDLSKIQRIDTAGIQFLIFTKTYCLENHIHLTLQNHSLPILKIYDVLGLVGFFGDKIKLNKELSSELEFSYGTKKE
jgi:anti-anti-sigma regulatory factor